MTPPTETPANIPSTAATGQWQSNVDALEEAARACDAHGDQAAALDDRIIWRHHALTVLNAADALRLALPFPLPITFPDSLEQGNPAADPLQLLTRAWDQLERLPDAPGDLSNVPLLLARFDVADALAAVRTHYE